MMQQADRKRDQLACYEPEVDCKADISVMFLAVFWVTVL
jgi:hypothetical protein